MIVTRRFFARLSGLSWPPWELGAIGSRAPRPSVKTCVPVGRAFQRTAPTASGSAVRFPLGRGAPLPRQARRSSLDRNRLELRPPVGDVHVEGRGAVLRSGEDRVRGRACAVDGLCIDFVRADFELFVPFITS